MPTYQYECSGCGHEFEALQSMMEDRLKKCPKCRKMKLNRLIGSGSGIIFKGSGFYETDYKRKQPSADKTDNDKDKGQPAKTEPAKTQTPKSGGCGCHGTSSCPN